MKVTACTAITKEFILIFQDSYLGKHVEFIPFEKRRVPEGSRKVPEGCPEALSELSFRPPHPRVFVGGCIGEYATSILFIQCFS